MTFWRAVIALLAKDLRLEMRSKETLLTAWLMAVLILLVFVFALDLRGPVTTEGLLIGLYWSALLFGAVIGIGRSFAKERHDGRMLAMLLAPVDRAAIFFAKWAGMLLLVIIVAAASLVVFVAFFDVSLKGGLWRWAVLIALVAAGMAGIGVLLAAVAAHTRAPDLLLPVLLLPLLVPLLLGAVTVGRDLLAAGDWGGSVHWLRMMLAYDLLFVVVPTLLFEYVVEV